FLDSRLPLFLGVAGDYRRVCLALDLPASNPGAKVRSEEGWRDALAERDVSCLVLYDPDLGRMTPALRQVARTPQRWRLLRVDGQAVLIGWEGAADAPPAALSFDPDREAFHPGSSPLPPGRDDEPGTLAESQTPWWSVDLKRRGAESSWEAASAAVY